MKTGNPNRPTPTQKRLVLAALTLGLALTTPADDFDMEDPIFPTPLVQTQRFGISPFYGYRFGGEVEDITTGAEYRFKDAPAYGVFLDYAPPNYFGRFELLWSRQDSSINFQGNNGLGNVDLTIDVIQAGGVAEYGSEQLRGYVSAHLGATHYSSDDYGNDTKFSFGIGTGVKAYLTKNLYLRADIRGFCTVVDAEGGFLYVNGITVARFSGSTLWQGQVSVGLGFTF
jgi:Outer membrane protein beta-barrel domain